MSKTRTKARQRASSFSRAAILVIVASAALISWFALVLFDKYNDTRIWETTRLNTEYATIAPLFARNYIDETMSKDIEELSNLSKTITKIEKNNGLTGDDRKTVDNIIKNAEDIMSRYENIPNELTLQLETLTIYRDIHDFLKTAYEKPDSETLANLIGKLTTVSLSDARDVHKHTLSVLSTIAEQYGMVYDLVYTKLPELVEVKENRVLMYESTNQAKTNEVLDYINQNDLVKFKIGGEVAKLLKSKTWSVALKNNTNYVEWTNWQNFEQALNGIDRNQYIRRSELKTYADILNFPNVTIYGGVDRKGYELLTSSPIKSITYNGIVLDDDTLIHINAAISITIQPEYRKVETKEEPEEDNKEKENKEEKDEDTSSSTSETSTSQNSSTTVTESSTEQTTTEATDASNTSTQLEELINNLSRDN